MEEIFDKVEEELEIQRLIHLVSYSVMIEGLQGFMVYEV